MSLLFDERVHVQAAFTTNSLSSNIDETDEILIGTELWKRLTSTSSESKRICVSISSPSTSSNPVPEDFRALTSWAVHDEQTESLAIPGRWVSSFRNIFSSGSVVVCPTEPVPLTEIVISALSSEAYEASVSHQDIVQRSLSGSCRILRQGEIRTVDLAVVNGTGSSQSKLLQFRLDMVEPVIQGFIEHGKSKIIVIPSFEDQDSEVRSEMDETDSNSDSEGVEIDEDFLGNSVSQFTFHPISPSPEKSTQLGAGHTATNGEFTLEAKPLPLPISAVQDDHTLYLRTADLSRVGLLNGDWSIACSSSQCRLARVVANDSAVETSDVVKGSPIILRNLDPENSYGPSRISLRPSPFGSGDPTVPTAVSITIARIASPISINRSYQTLFLNALKLHFQGRKRLIKQGDIIAVAIDTDELIRHNETVQGEDTRVTEESPVAAYHNNDVVFFMVTNTEYDTISKGKEPVQMDAYFGSTTGELGCWFDPDVTRMVQAGLEQSRIPDVYSYLEIGGVVAQDRALPFKPQSSSREPFDQLYSIASVILEPSGGDYNLQLTTLLKGSRGVGKFTVASAVARLLGLHLLEVNCYDVIGENDTKTEALLQTRFENAASCAPCILLLRHLEAFAQSTQTPESGKEPVLVGALRECIETARQTWKKSGHPVMVCGTTSQPDRVPTTMLSCFKHEVTFEAPDEHVRAEMLRVLLDHKTIAPDVSTSLLAQQTAAFVAGDLVDLVHRAEAAATLRVVTDGNNDEISSRKAGIPLTSTDFDKALGHARAAYSESIGAPKIPSVSWNDVGGLAQVKSDIMDTIQLPLDHPELFADGLKKRSGILLYGPPGTGKTLIAKAVATSFSLNFFSVKGPELLNMYIGESEANVRRVFQRARDAKPCVIFFDELDSIAPKRGNQGDSGGVMDRIVSQLLAELDGASGGSGSADVFVIGATNRPDLLDPALLRPGRFDRMLYLGVSQTHEAQVNIMEALTRKFRLHPDLDLKAVAEQCSFNYTGADFYALCSDALLNAMTRKAEELEEKIAELNKLPPPYRQPHPLTPQYYLAEMASEEDIQVLVTQNDFDRAVRNLIPSVSQAEMDHYRTIQSRFSRSQLGVHDN
ncbi:AAA-domain-containing protein [Marasmius fiardii PR-910]|nr:AAA-domain-containing protein [Marasmius fiardii PR-910]